MKIKWRIISLRLFFSPVSPHGCIKRILLYRNLNHISGEKKHHTCYTLQCGSRVAATHLCQMGKNLSCLNLRSKHLPCIKRILLYRNLNYTYRKKTSYMLYTMWLPCGRYAPICQMGKKNILSQFEI